jgi:hypothetical protein
VNKWNFISFVPNVTFVEMAPLWPYDSMDSHGVGVWIPMVNGTWIPLISPTSWKKPKIELKLQGWCVNDNFLSYVFDPNM